MTGLHGTVSQISHHHTDSFLDFLFLVKLPLMHAHQLDISALPTLAACNFQNIKAIEKAANHIYCVMLYVVFRSLC